MNGTEIELGRTAGDPPDGGFPHSTTPIDVTIPAPSATGPYEIEATSMRFAPFGYPPDNPEQFTVTCNVTTSGGPLGTVDIAEPTTTTSSTTTTTTSTTSTTTTSTVPPTNAPTVPPTNAPTVPPTTEEPTVPPTVPPTTPPSDVTTIDGVGVTSQGCDVSVPIHFAEAGDYTLTVRTATGRDIGSTDITRGAAGDHTVEVTIDGNHGLHHGDEIDLVLTDSTGATVAEAGGVVDDPNACTPATPTTTSPGNNGTTKPLVQSNTAPPATPTAANPAYTG
ncbi:MAG TPA: hypothetical protein VFN21_09215 [Acidimicrobiales bacterium]|nr:hypothetical protein [Acidimicrobiales bacterium]